jgi:hypothetical protein
MREFSCNDSTITSSVSRLPDTAGVRLVTAQKLEHAAPWFFHVAQGMPVFYVVAFGQCRLWLDERDEGFLLETGDVAVLPRGESHWLQYGQHKAGTGSCDTPRRTTIIRGRFTWNEREFASLFPQLLPVVHFRNEDGQVVSWMKGIVRLNADQSNSDRPEARAVINYLAYAILVESVHASIRGSQ